MLKFTIPTLSILALACSGGGTIEAQVPSPVEQAPPSAVPEAPEPEDPEPIEAADPGPPAEQPVAWMASHQAAFDELLATSRLSYQPVEGFELRPGGNHPALPYEAALVDSEAGLEVRLSIRPLANIEIHYEDPHSSAPEPNHAFALMFRAVIEQLSPSGLGNETELPPIALEPYNASWGAVVTLDLKRQHFPDHAEAVLLTLHLEDAADVYLLFLPEDLKAAQPRIKDALRVLTFQKPAEAPTED